MCLEGKVKFVGMSGDNQAAAGITNHAPNLRLKASLPEDECWCESQ